MELEGVEFNRLEKNEVCEYAHYSYFYACSGASMHEALYMRLPSYSSGAVYVLDDNAQYRDSAAIRHNAPDVRDKKGGRAAGQFHITHKRFLLHLLGKPIALSGSSARTTATRTNLRAVVIFVTVLGMQKYNCDKRAQFILFADSIIMNYSLLITYSTLRLRWPARHRLLMNCRARGGRDCESPITTSASELQVGTQSAVSFVCRARMCAYYVAAAMRGNVAPRCGAVV